MEKTAKEEDVLVWKHEDRGHWRKVIELDWENEDVTFVRHVRLVNTGLEKNENELDTFIY